MRKLVIVLALSLASNGAWAQPLKNIAQKNDVNKPALSTNVDSLVDKFYNASQEDLTVALAYAIFAEDKSAVACYTEWVKQVEGIIKLRETFPDQKGPQFITAFQKARNLVKRLDTDSPLRQACAALAADAKSDVKNLITGIISGAALKALTGGLIP